MKGALTRITTTALVAIFFVSFLAIFVPPAAAQADKELKVNCCKFTARGDTGLVDGKLLPEVAVATFDVTAEVLVPAQSGCFQNIQVVFSKKNAPPYANVFFTPTSTSKPIGSENPNVPTDPVYTQERPVTVGPVTMSVTVNRNAPAFETPTYEVTASASAAVSSSGSCNLSPKSGDGQTAIQNGFLALIQVNPASLFVKSGQNKKVTFPVEVQNYGNGPTRVIMELTPQNPKKQLDSMNAGSDLRLESRAGKPAAPKVTRNIEVTTPHSNGYTNTIYSFFTKFTAKYDGPASGNLLEDTATVQFAVQVQGVYVPGYDSVTAIGAVGIGLIGFAALRRRN